MVATVALRPESLRIEFAGITEGDFYSAVLAMNFALIVATWPLKN
jgi:hypothetical protein